MSYIAEIKNHIISFIASVYQSHPEFSQIIKKITIECNVDVKRSSFGDCSTNAPLIIAKMINCSPETVGKKFVENFSKNDQFFDSVIYSPNGFVNFIFISKVYDVIVATFLKNELALISKVNDPKEINVEFVSANPTGPLHVGHARGGIIGDTLVRILRAKGHKVASEFYINDHGNQIKKLGESLKARYQNICGSESVLPDGGYKGEYLVDCAQKLFTGYQNKLLDNSIEWFSEFAKDEMLKDINETLDEYKISFDKWFSENSLYDDGSVPSIAQWLLEKGYAYHLEDKSLWFKASSLCGDSEDWVICRANGEYTYTASDLAYLKNKIDRGFTTLIMVLGQDHHGFAKRMKQITSLFSEDVSLEVILYQMVTVTDKGQLMRLSKRSGNIIALYDIVKTVGSDAARFFYLNRDAGTHLDFDVHRALEHSEHNPVFYIQYAIVRMKSILRSAHELKIAWNFISDEEEIGYHYQQNERILIRKVDSFDTMLDTICCTRSTYLLANYTSHLASLFHSFYNSSSCLHDENRSAVKKRVRLVALLQKTMTIATELLGITSPEVM